MGNIKLVLFEFCRLISKYIINMNKPPKILLQGVDGYFATQLSGFNKVLPFHI
jgi:hypothetical protein